MTPDRRCRTPDEQDRNTGRMSFLFIQHVTTGPRRPCGIGLLILLANLMGFVLSPANEIGNPTLALAVQMAAEDEHHLSAIEFRREALNAEEPGEKGACYWAAGYEYLKAGHYKLSADMLDRAEDLDPGVSIDAVLLRAEIAARLQRYDESIFYYNSILNSNVCDDMKILASRRLSSVYLRTGQTDTAIKAILNSPTSRNDKIEAIRKYEEENDKVPWLGGILGLLPGLGYAYSGEHSNALRSFILNGLFIYGMIDTADREQWGAFTAISFFELTWYSGSVYGGLDAAHRHNRDRLNRCIALIEGDTDFSADLSRIPVVSIRFDF